MSKICFLIPDGVGIRNYLYSDLFKLLHEQGHQIVVWSNLDAEVFKQSKTVLGFTPMQKMFKVAKEDAFIQLLRECSTYARLRYNVRITDNPTIMLNWHGKHGSLKRKLLIAVSELLGKQIKKYEGIVATEKLYISKLKKNSFYAQCKTDLEELMPDLLFCTHQRYPGAAYAIEAAKALGIPTVTAIFSWDNLPKARLPLKSDYYTVWSDFMKDELRYYYPEISDKQIEVTGTPQFDFYKKLDLITGREAFAAEFGLDANKTWVCFSGCDSKTSPHDVAYLEDVARSLQNEEDIQLIFRQVPVEDISRYSEVLQKYPAIKHLQPFWHKGSYWSQFFPYPKDIFHLVDLSYHCAAVVNIGSTMALDFSWFNRPGLYLNYDHTADQKWRTQDVYNFQHFKSMGDWDAVVWANSPEQIREKILQIIHNPHQVAKDRKLWLHKIVGQLEGDLSAARISRFLNQKITQK